MCLITIAAIQVACVGYHQHTNPSFAGMFFVPNRQFIQIFAHLTMADLYKEDINSSLELLKDNDSTDNHLFMVIISNSAHNKMDELAKF